MPNIMDLLNIRNTHLTEEGMGFYSEMHVNDFHKQPLGWLHGGATMAFAETVGSYMSYELVKDKGLVGVGQAMSCQHLHPFAGDGILVAKGTLLHKGAKTHVWDMLFYDQGEHLIAHINFTVAIIQARPDQIPKDMKVNF